MCTDPEADNYNPDATIDDGSCVYGSANFSFGSITGDNIQILMDNSEAVAGFQFTLTDNPDVLTITGASGGSAEENSFEVSTSDLGIVIGLSAGYFGGRIDSFLMPLKFCFCFSLGTSKLVFSPSVFPDDFNFFFCIC